MGSYDGYIVPKETPNSVALEFPTPLVVLNSTIRQALSFLFSTCDTVQTDKTERGICFTFTVSKMWITEDAE